MLYTCNEEKYEKDSSEWRTYCCGQRCEWCLANNFLCELAACTISRTIVFQFFDFACSFVIGKLLVEKHDFSAAKKWYGPCHMVFTCFLMRRTNHARHFLKIGTNASSFRVIDKVEPARFAVPPRSTLMSQLLPGQMNLQLMTRLFNMVGGQPSADSHLSQLQKHANQKCFGNPCAIQPWTLICKMYLQRPKSIPQRSFD